MNPTLFANVHALLEQVYKYCQDNLDDGFISIETLSEEETGAYFKSMDLIEAIFDLSQGIGGEE